jgi:hypothetical protein
VAGGSPKSRVIPPQQTKTGFAGDPVIAVIAVIGKAKTHFAADDADERDEVEYCVVGYLG